MISRLHYITQDLPEFSHPQLAEFACKGGADWVQLRVKHPLSGELRSQPTVVPKGEREIHAAWLKIAEETKMVCKKYGAKLIINDNVQIAKEIQADGVHLGKEDMSPREARKILGNNFIIGGSANTMEDARGKMAEGCDYIGIGPFRFTSTRERLNPILGLNGIANIITHLPNYPIPIIAIGGIKLEDIESLMKTGIHGVAVSSAINLSENKIESTKRFLDSLGMTKASMPL